MLRVRLVQKITTHPKRAGAVLVAAMVAVASLVAPPARAAIAFRSATSANNAGGASSITINTPAGATVGDVLVLTIDGRSTSTGTGPCLSVNNTFSSIVKTTHTSGNLYKASYYKVLTSTPPSSYTIDLCDGLVSQSHKASAGLVAFSGVDTSNPVDISGVNQGNSTTAQSTGVNTTVASTRLLILAGAATSTTCDPDNSLTERYEAVTTGQSTASRTTSCGADKTINLAGGTSSSSIALGAAADYIVHTIALRPVPASSLQQSGFRWFENTNSTTPGAAITAQNTSVIVPQAPIRLQTLVDQNLSAATSFDAYKLQYAQRGADNVCDISFNNETYKDVGPTLPVAGSVNTVATNAVNDTSKGTVAWTNLNNTYIQDGAVASAALPAGATSNNLELSDFLVPTLPAGAQITGLSVHTVGTFAAFMYEYVSLSKNGGAYNDDGNPIAQGQDAGGPTNLWGNTWTAADIGNMTMRVRVLNDTTSSRTAMIDSISVEVHYSVPEESIKFADNSSVSNAATAVNGGMTSAKTIKTQSYNEVNPFSPRAANLAQTGETALYDFALNLSATPTGTYCFRVVKSDGTPLQTYSVIPQMTVALPTMNQSSYRFFQNANAAVPGTVLAAQNTAATVATQTPFRLRQLITQSTSTAYSGSRSMKLQYAIRSGVCDTSFNGETYLDFDAGQLSTGPQLTATANSEISVDTGTYSWSNPTNVYSDDGARVGVNSLNTSVVISSNILQTKGYGLSVPTNATITGIEVAVEESGAGGGTAYIDVRLTKNGTSSGFKAGTNNLDVVAGQVFTYGSSSDLWGLTWTPAEVNSATFSADIQARLRANMQQGDVSAYADYVGVNVYYTLPSNNELQLNNNLGVSSGSAVSATANDPTPPSGAAVLQSYVEAMPFTSLTPIGQGDSGLWDFSLTSSASAANKTYCFRVVNQDDTPLTTYTQIPEVTIGSGGSGPTLQQQLRGGQAVVDGVKSFFSW